MRQYTDRQIEIMEAATKRIDKHGIQNLTIKNLAADIGLSEPALYRHFAGKNEILMSLLEFFQTEMKKRLESISSTEHVSAANELKSIFNTHLKAIAAKPSTVSIIFSESIFHFDDELSSKVAEIIGIMHTHVSANIKRGQEIGQYGKLINVPTLTTIIIGAMRLTILKWKLSGHKSNVVKAGNAVLEGILKMIIINK